jgi:hypothetical protein
MGVGQEVAVTRSWRAVAIVATGVVAAVLYCNFVLDVVLPGSHDLLTVVSEMEMEGQEHAHLLRVTDVICGILTIAILPPVWSALPPDGWRRTAVAMTVVFAIGNALAGVVRLPCTVDNPDCTGGGADLQRWLHDGFSIVSAAALFLGALAVAADTKRHGPRWLHQWARFTFWVGGVLGTVVFAAAGAADPTSWQTGVSQRVQLVISSAWVVCLSVYAAGDGLRARGGWFRSRPRSDG